LRAYVLIQAEDQARPLAQRLMAIPGVLSAADVSGAYDAIALAGAGSTRLLLEQVINTILSLPGVTRALPAPLIPSLAERPETDSASSDAQPGSGDRAA
jgi:AsnC-like helix-turn-helix protein